MADYIDREKLLKSIPSLKEDKTISLFGAVADMICIVNSVPKEDVAPVVHARWVDDHCTACGYGVNPWNNTPYCHRCGAKMDAEQEE